MSLLQAERKKRAYRRTKKPDPPEWSVAALEAPLSISHPHQILTLFEWAQLNRISLRTARRIIASADGPVVTQLSTKRIGISVGNNAAWQASKARR
jgi:hypothetical protein